MKRRKGDQVPKNLFLYIVVVLVGVAARGTFTTITVDAVPLSDWTIRPITGAESEIAAANKVGRRTFKVHVNIWVIMPL
jgi:hypothetical protein